MWYFPEQSKSGAGHRDGGGLRRRGNRAVALVVVLSLIVIVCLILVAFVAAMSMDRTASAGYSQSLAADQIGQGALRLVIAELGNEMSKDALPDLTYPSKPLYTNVSSTNILPQRVGTNSAMPNLVKISSPTAFYTGTLRNSGLVATTNSTATPSKNGRYMDTNRWNAPFLGTFPNAASLPNWVLVTRGGYASSGSFGTTGNSLNNPALGNTNYAIGRFAYAIYDLGGLLDITVAGHPASLTAEQINQIKGSLAGADLTSIGITNVDAFINWRNSASAASASTYLAHITNFVATNGIPKVAPGDTTFLTRQDLIKAAQQNVAGLSTDALTNLTTFTREKNAPSWKPMATVDYPTNNTVNYLGLSTNLTAGTNFFVPFVRHAAAGNVTTYNAAGSATNYPVVAGDPVVSRKFPLSRLKWIGPNGPQNGGTAENIQACFGLVWGASADPALNGAKVWKYVGPNGSTELGSIAKLPQIAGTGREPNFFELLQAGMLSGSLASEKHLAFGGVYNSYEYYTQQDAKLAFHVFRIGASILSQYDSSNYPIVVEYTDPASGSGSNRVPWQIFGVENLPYLNMFTALAGRDTTMDTPTTNSSSVGCYLLFGLWNPHQTLAPSTSALPRVRLRVKGSVTLMSYLGDYALPVYVYGIGVPGYVANIDDTIELSSAGMATPDPHALLPGDVAVVPTEGTSAGMTWATLPSTGIRASATSGGTVYVGYRLPNFNVDLTRKPTSSAPANLTYWQVIQIHFNTDLLKPFNFWLEYQDADGKWIPYNYYAGINDPATWITKTPGWSMEYLGPAVYPSSAPVPVLPNALQVIDPVSPLQGITGSDIAYYTIQYMGAVDPRVVRSHHSRFQTSNASYVWSNYLRSSIWAEGTDPKDASVPTYGSLSHQNVQAYFGPRTGSIYTTQGSQWRPATLSRNNTTAPGWGGAAPSYNVPVGAAYADPDGVQRIGDSGLFTAQPNTIGWRGSPYALSTTRKSDRPILLNRPFTSVGELGYVFRDYPWKTLDLFSANSADGGLLDLFTVNESNSPVVAGRISLNSANAKALEAAVTGMTADVLGNTALSKPSVIAADLAKYTSGVTAGTGPLLSREEIVTKFLPSLTALDFSVSGVNTDEQNLKPRREGVTRALVDVGQTRTWNLLIDITAQAGRYSPVATSLDQFVVEGERRFWLQIAIDRFTGEVVDQQLETVTQ